MSDKTSKKSANPKTDAPSDNADLIVIGRFAAPFGVRGWLHVTAFGARADSFMHNRKWWCASNSEELSTEGWKWLEVENIRPVRGNELAVKLHDIETREQADFWRGGGIALPRDWLPPLSPKEEFYWCDLIGLSAVNEEGVQLGRIDRLMRTGAHDILCIVPPIKVVDVVDESISDVDKLVGDIEAAELSKTDNAELSKDDKDDVLPTVEKSGKVRRVKPPPLPAEMLVPFIDEYVLDVNIAGGTVCLRWQADWL